MSVAEVVAWRDLMAGPLPGVLPMQLQRGDRFRGEAGAWEVIGRPFTTVAGRNAQCRDSEHQPAQTDRLANMGGARMHHGEANWQSADILGAALEAFIREHEFCGELDAGLEDDRVWMTCTCGAVMSQALEPTGRE